MTQPISPAGVPSQPVFPHSSADWRFLLPITKDSRLLIVGGEQDDYSDLFCRAGMASVSWHKDVSVSTLSDLPSSSFDVVAFPLGLPAGTAVPRSIRFLLRPGGTLFFGFSNIRGLSRDLQAGMLESNPWLLSGRLRRSGYSQVELFGVRPSLGAPENIFPLQYPSLNFTLQNRYRYKLPAGLSRLVFHRFMAGLLSNIIPHYFVVAKLDS
jgi:hypothetical protein